MAGLIPLLLKPAALSHKTNALIHPNPSSVRRSTTGLPPTIVEEQLQSETPPSLPPRPRQMKRLSFQAPAHLPVLPFTPSEWSKAVAEVKRQYTNRRYRPCSVRCTEILDNIKDEANVEQAHLIYLHFYAASSLEMSARPLHASSPYRTKILQQARHHYTRAGELIQAEDLVMAQHSRRSSTNSSSLHSPSASISSRAWTTSTGFSSPTPSICSLEDAVLNIEPQAPPAKKRVTFSDLQEPVIRPDSPTLGFDDWLGRPSPDLPSILSSKTAKAPVTPTAEHPEETKEEQGLDDAVFLREQSVSRYCAVLSSLREQLTAHLASIESELSKPSAEERLSGRSTPDCLGNSDELRVLEIRSRIERLKQNGWQRKRFDVTRYETLRESVMAELS